MNKKGFRWNEIQNSLKIHSEKEKGTKIENSDGRVPYTRHDLLSLLNNDTLHYIDENDIIQSPTNLSTTKLIDKI